VDQETLLDVKTIEFPVVFAVAARFGSVRLLDNVELEPPVSPQLKIVFF
jgi:pantothenate synthetase